MPLEIKIVTNRQVQNGSYGSDIPDNYKEMFLANPFADDYSPMQLKAILDNRQVGSVYAFPLQIVQQGVGIYEACAGSSLSVDVNCRGNGIGGKLTMRRLDLMKDGIAIASGLSSMSLPIFRKKGFDIFLSRRWIYLKDSRPVLEMFLPSGIILNLAVKAANCLINMWQSVLKRRLNVAFRGLTVEESWTVPPDVPNIVADEGKPFRENHTKEWFEWVLNGKFVDDERAKQHLYLVKEKSEIIGFFMTKERFHKQASHRGFRNVILGSVIEWGLRCGSTLSTNDLLLFAIMSFGKHVNAVELCSFDDKLDNYLKHRLLVQVGEGNFAVKANGNSPLNRYPEFHKAENWRLRPAASDNSFN